MIYTNNTVEGINSNTSLFANDTKIKRKIKVEEDCKILEGDLDRIYMWSQEWEIKFNACISSFYFTIYPHIEFHPQIGDSVVSKGREILERSIQLVNSHPTWAAKVVYGDTDSLFVHLPGRSRSQAFAIGQEIAATITKMYPKPIKLKFEKVYLPCLLQVIKRDIFSYLFPSFCLQ